MDFFKRENERNIDMARSRKKFARSSNKRELFFYFNNNQLCCALLRPRTPSLCALLFETRVRFVPRYSPVFFLFFFLFSPSLEKNMISLLSKARKQNRVEGIETYTRIYMYILLDIREANIFRFLFSPFFSFLDVTRFDYELFLSYSTETRTWRPTTGMWSLLSICFTLRVRWDETRSRAI